MRRFLLCGVTAMTVFAAACGDDDGTGLVRVASVSLTPDSARTGAVLLVGDTLPLEVTAKDASGNTVLGRVAQFFSTSDAIARVTTDGKVIGVGEGTATITARVDNQQATATVNVVKPYTLVSVGGKQLPVTIPGENGQPALVLNSGAVALYAANGRFFLRIRYGAGDPLIESGTYTTGANGVVTFTSSVTQGLVLQGTLSGNTLTFDFGQPGQPQLWVFTK